MNVETVRESLDAINSSDFDRVCACFTDDVVFDGTRIAEGIYQGKASYRSFLEESKRTNAYRFSNYTLLLDEDTVIAVVDTELVGSRSGASTLGRLGFRYQMRDGLIARQEIHADVDELLREQGLEDPRP